MTLYTISEPFNSELRVQSSKFLSFAFPITSEEEVKSIVREFQKKYFDATHVCYAYALGKHSILKAHDAGEPPHTAGTPILNTIRSEYLTNILVVVVRYFGGTKLGKTGLIQAYKAATLSSIQPSKRIEFIELAKITIEIPYEKLGGLLELLRKHHCHILDKTIGNTCSISFQVPLEKELEIRSKLS